MPSRKSRAGLPIQINDASSLHPFLPPSHYAAANGISYPLRPPKSPMQSPMQNSSNSSPGAYMDVIARELNYSTQGNDFAMRPATHQISNSASSNSSFEFKDISELPPNHSGSIRPTPSKSNLREKRQSTMSGHPDIEGIETMLLPSLNDTISRMTRPPSRSATNSPSHFPSYESSRHSQESHSALSRPLDSPLLRNTSSASENSAYVSPIYKHQSPATPLPGVTLKSKSLPKPSLKTALKSPTPSISSVSTNVTSAKSPTESHSQTKGSSLKSLTSMIGRKMSITSNSSPKQSFLKGKKSSDHLVAPSGRSRSNTDPGLPPISGRRTPKISLPTEPLPHSFNKLDTTDKTSTETGPAVKSNIPRAKARFTGRIATSTDDSDFEYRQEQNRRNSRRLVVANAEVFHSSSSSDCGVEHLRLAKEGPEQRVVGLGLSVSKDQQQGPFGTDGRYTEDGRQQHNLRFLQKIQDASKNPDEKYPQSDSYSSIYSDIHENNQAADIVADHERRHAALMNIVSGLQPGFHVSRISQESHYSDENEYGVDGSTESFYGDDSITSSQWLDKPASVRSRMPTVTFSAPDHYEPSHEDRNQKKISLLHSRLNKESSQYHDRLKSPVTCEEMTRVPSPTSRSPIIRLSETTLPAALQKHSVYHNDIVIQATKSDIDPVGGSTPYSSHGIAARERQALGIPPSQSDEDYQMTERMSRMSHTDSDLSSLGSSQWQDGIEELSVGAETLFMKLSERPSRENRRQDRAISRGSTSRRGPHDNINDVTTESAQKSPNHGLQTERGSFDSTTTPNLGLHLQGQEKFIEELHSTEAIFIDRLQVCVELFILPLRLQNDRKWIAGVPANIARLLDWLEDILNLHKQIYQLLDLKCRNEKWDITDLTESLLSLVPKIEVYQPYLVRLADVSEEIDEAMRNRRSHFGEFVVLQEKSPLCEGWSLENFLMEPVNRLAEYQDIFSRLQESTPKTDSSYLSTSCLRRSTDMVIRVLTEVKVREDEYDTIKKLSSRLSGFPATFELAVRERRLLFQGALKLHSRIDTQTLENLQKNEGQKQPSRLEELIQSMDTRSKTIDVDEPDSTRSGSSTSSRSTGTSNSSLRKLPQSLLPVLSSSMRQRPSRSHSNTLSGNEQGTNLTTSSDSVLVQVFVFSDILILAIPEGDKQGQEEHWSLLHDIGISRVFDIKTLQDDIFLEAEIIPMNVETTTQDIFPRRVGLRSIWFAMPSSLASSSGSRKTGQDNTSCVAAFQKCVGSTKRSLSVPWLPINMGLDSDLFRDTQKTVYSLLSSGLPIPKSPSGHVPIIQDQVLENSAQCEREERGWWSLRFQQVLRELRRQID